MVTSKLTAPSTSVPSVMPLHQDINRVTAPFTPIQITPPLEMALSDLVNQSYEEGNVMEFIGLYDIPYIFLSPDEPLHISLAEFLASPDWFHNFSMFVPNASFP